jgi:hypothetical protein
VRELGVLTRAELGVDRQERDQAMLELRPLPRPGGAGQDLQAAVHLKRIGRHGDRILPEISQPSGQRDRHGGLPHASGSEQGDDFGARHATEYREAMMTEVAG